MNKICTKCKKEKSVEEFGFTGKTHTTRSSSCKACQSEYQKEYRKTYVVPEKTKQYRQNYRDTHKKEISDYHKIYNEENKEKIRARQQNYDKNNRDKINARKRQYEKQRRKQDPFYKLRKNVSRRINVMLKEQNGSKQRASIFDYLPYTFNDLVNHIASKFESWMTWENQGRYNPNIWIDDDQSTWTWQLDHIVPQTNTPFVSMEDENFKKCWALENLRPYNAKYNVLEADRR